MIVLAGAGDTGMKFYQESRSKGDRIDFVCDNDPELNGAQFFENIIQPTQILETINNKKDMKVYITALIGYEEFKQQILGYGIPESNIFRIHPKPEIFPFHSGTTIDDVSGFIKTFNDEGIKCLAGWGTLLGLIRDGQIMPHDYDIDIWVMEDTLDKLTNEVIKKSIGAKLSLPAFAKTRYLYMPDNRYCKVKGPAMKSLSYYFTDGSKLKVDFFLLCKNDPFFYTTTGRADLYRLPVDFFKSMKTFKTGRFEHIVPAKYNELLTFIYGDWQTPVLPDADGKYMAHLNRIDDPNSSFDI